MCNCFSSVLGLQVEEEEEGVARAVATAAASVASECMQDACVEVRHVSVCACVDCG